MNYDILPATDTRLNGISAPVAETGIISHHVQTVIDTMIHIATYARDADKPAQPTMVGLAAPQIGVFERIILIDRKAVANVPNYEPDLHAVINPEIAYASPEEQLGREGCYSTGELAAAVYWANIICVRGLTRQGEPVSYTLDGFQARIFQHEIDHLNGIRCPDRIRSPRHLHGFTDRQTQFQAYRDHWQDWPLQYPVESWLNIKNGQIVARPVYPAEALAAVKALSEPQQNKA